jgi:uncharacterized protein DUF6599
VRRVPVACLAILLGALIIRPASAQNLLPSAFGSWNSSQSAPTQPSSLEQVSGQNAPIIREYGFEALEQREYVLSGEKSPLDVTVYRMVDPTAAYGAFTFLRLQGMAASNLTKYGATSKDRAFIVVGNFLLDVHGAAVSSPHSELNLLVDALRSKADPRPYPLVVEHLPPAGLVAGSERYVSGPLALHALLPVADGDWLGFAQSGEAVFARYRKGAQEVTLLIAEYPTQQLAASRYEKISPILHAPPDTAQNKELHVVASRRDAGLISIVLGNRPTDYADALLGQIIFGHNVVWNEPSFKAKELPWSAYVIGSFLGSGIIIVFAFVSGLGFALVRLIVKRFFPGKVFDRPRSMEVIQLGLSGRRVSTKDGY